MAQPRTLINSPRSDYDAGSNGPVAIVGAGPYGLAAAAHLEMAGIRTTVFGKPMEFWRENMPIGMKLRSGWEACFISHPRNDLTLDHYQRATDRRVPRPVPLEDFVDYGHWFQRQLAINPDPRRVARIEPVGQGFRLTLEDGELLNTHRVVVAAGIAPFAWRPPQYRGLPADLVSHSSEHQDLTPFVGRRVLVVGGGQSALESAALLHETGADVELVMRAREVIWIRSNNPLKSLPVPLRYVFYPPTDVGPLGLCWLIALPDLFRQLPRRSSGPNCVSLHRSNGRGMASRPVEGVVRMTTNRKIVSARADGKGVRVGLDDGTERSVDHVLLGTGFRIDISKYPFLSAQLTGAIRQVNGYPVLGTGMESSVPGLHFLGAPAALSFGPLMRFVSGTTYATRALGRKVLHEMTVRK